MMEKMHIGVATANEKLDGITGCLINIQRDLVIIKQKCTAIKTQLIEMDMYQTPRYFLVYPESPERFTRENWTSTRFRLYFICECGELEGFHMTNHGGYIIRKPKEFFRKYGPYLRKTLPIISEAFRAAGCILPGLGLFSKLFELDMGLPDDTSNINDILNCVDSFVKKVNNVPSDKDDIPLLLSDSAPGFGELDGLLLNEMKGIVY
ncbi:hypothetical protein HDV00_006172 [Rhizophlyctis rosea]|nr:hypothetical protein HDV00_006172 [Rhizophlyctis rosea]